MSDIISMTTNNNQITVKVINMDRTTGGRIYDIVEKRTCQWQHSALNNAHLIDDPYYRYQVARTWYCLKASGYICIGFLHAL